jgi:hypothetical protein
MTFLRSRKPEINGRGDSLRWPHDTHYPLKLALTSPTSGGRSVGIVRLRTKAPEFLVHDVFVAAGNGLGSSGRRVRITRGLSTQISRKANPFQC